MKSARHYIRIHTTLAVSGFSLLIYLNRFIVTPGSMSSYLSDIYVGHELTKAQTLEMYQTMLGYVSISIPTSGVGIVFCAMGFVVFVIGLVRAWKQLKPR